VLDALLMAFPTLGLAKIVWAVDIILAMDLPDFQPAALGAPGDWHDVMATKGFKVGETQRVEATAAALFVHRAVEEWHVYDSRCPHQTTDIPHLALEGCTLTCPKHDGPSTSAAATASPRATARSSAGPARSSRAAAGPLVTPTPHDPVPTSHTNGDRHGPHPDDLALTPLAALYAVALPGLATNGMNMEGYGPVSTGMGGASQALDHGTAAMAQNPATLGLMGAGARLDLAVGRLGPRSTAPSRASAVADSGRHGLLHAGLGYARRSGALTYGVGVSPRVAWAPSTAPTPSWPWARGSRCGRNWASAACCSRWPGR
jgi:hypothetical protein